MRDKRRKILIYILSFGILTGLAAGAGMLVYGLNLSTLVENRFSGRRWQLPSRVYSDVTLLYPGQGIQPALFLQKLERLNYRKVNRLPESKGEMRLRKDGIDLYLHDSGAPPEKRPGFPVDIRLGGNRIVSITRPDTKASLAVLELEPEELALFFGPERERRRLVAVQQLPDHLIQAVLAAEDENFYRHHGVSLKGMLRAVYHNLSQGGIRQGGSTITQQLAKNFFLTPERTIKRKLKEILIAAIMELKYQKEEILEIYLNEIYFGQKGSESVNGVGEAALLYFGKQAEELGLSESAVIAGLIKSPNRYSPYRHPEDCRRRRNQVLQAMAQNGWLGKSLLADLEAAPVKTAGFRKQTRKAPYFIDYLHQQLDALYSREDLASLGLSIYTTLDTQVQLAAEEALENGLQRLEKRIPALRKPKPEDRLQGAVIVVQPRTGYILAMVGGRQYGRSQFNRITQARRQTGSIFKPFVCLSALNKFTPASFFSNAPRSYSTDQGKWTPQNYEETPETPVPMRTALAHSYNRATVDMAMQTGLGEVIRTARLFAFSTELQPYPSLALGAFEAIPLEMARAYCTFAADGFQPYLLAVKDIADTGGRFLSRRHIQVKQIIPAAKAYLITSMLRSVVTEGTARRLSTLPEPFPSAGKTGTTNQYRDAWYVGYTPDILALIWVGFDNGGSIRAAGSAAALPIWADLMRAIPQHLSGNWFPVPPGVVTVTICRESGWMAGSGCPETLEEVFLEENQPAMECPLHSSNLFHHILKGIKDVVE
ncbi:MAG: PBP1A family penicillin-binding protein [Thermodesulfobacteriota bacterium]